MDVIREFGFAYSAVFRGVVVVCYEPDSTPASAKRMRSSRRPGHE